MTPNDVVGHSLLRIIQGKPLATKQLDFARDAAPIPADSSIGGNHPMARDVDRHGIVVQRIADSPRAVGGSRCRCQRLVADYRTARHRLQFVQNLFLKGMSHQGQVDVLA